MQPSDSGQSHSSRSVTLWISPIAHSISFRVLETVELSRLCSSSPHLCRVTLRLWREAVFRKLKKPYAISYQDAKLHTGNTYRFDGWRKIGTSRSGPDTRSGRKGRSKVIWMFTNGDDDAYRG